MSTVIGSPLADAVRVGPTGSSNARRISSASLRKSRVKVPSSSVRVRLGRDSNQRPQRPQRALRHAALVRPRFQLRRDEHLDVDPGRFAQRTTGQRLTKLSHFPLEHLDGGSA